MEFERVNEGVGCLPDQSTLVILENEVEKSFAVRKVKKGEIEEL